MKYIEFSKGKQNLFLRSVKLDSGFSWKELAKILEVSRSMIYFYLNENSKISYSKYIMLCKIAGINPDQIGNKIIEIRNSEEEIAFPSISEKLAEFLGALAGDGHLSKINHEVSIAMDKRLDKDYSEHILRLYYELFGITARKYSGKGNGIKCFAYSKRLCEFLSSKYNLPIGKKKNRLHIPSQIKANRQFLLAYIRGVFDTDGSFNRHHKKDAMVSIISRDIIFLQEINEALSRIGFTVSFSNKNVQIYRKEEIDRFFKEIKPSNAKHTFKYLYYKKYKRVPLTKEIIKR